MRADLLFPPGHAGAATTLGDTVFTDLGLTAVCAAMADGDPVLLTAARTGLTSIAADAATVRYRQAVFADCCAHPDRIRRIYDIACAATEVRRWTIGRGSRPGGKLLLALQPVAESMLLLRRLRAECDGSAAYFESSGLTALCAQVRSTLPDEYFDEVGTHLAALDFDHGMHLSISLGPGNKPVDPILHAPPRSRPRGLRRRPGAFEAADDFEAGTTALTRFRSRALEAVADVVSRAADGIGDFFLRLRTELAFYLGGLTLWQRVRQAGVPVCVPSVLPAGSPGLHCLGLRDIGLGLTGEPVVGVDVSADDRSLLVVTGANNGGKTTFLRSVGVVQIMMQAGLFVAADEFVAPLRTGVFTHFAPEEDRTLTRGRLAEELAGMSRIVDRVAAGGLLLCNESFASTGEHDAARIAGPLIAALVDSGVTIVFVTHLHEFAAARRAAAHPSDLFLRAGCADDGTRTYRMTPGAPRPEAHGADLFRQVFGLTAPPAAGTGY
ncbi:MutS-related protein [Nocardia sp. alder85J]|uniref:MutS-related protein n=1 Tax=Nocardia sp. alder85J TaxID=2862949 RepID=UPI001CD5B387|nr:DNA mismatch repair protein [Nocardia sp. alder85J]MCX4091209.1 DNA mismatch repair protein [Nocardia sp. alder85J]